MKIILDPTPILKIKTQALINFLAMEEVKTIEQRDDLIAIADIIKPRLEAGDFKAEYLETLTLFPQGIGPERIILVGLGPEKDLRPARLREAAAKATQTAVLLKLEQTALLPPPVRASLTDMGQVAEFIILGAILGQQVYGELKTKDKDKKRPLTALNMVMDEKSETKALRSAINAAEITADAVYLARTLGNRPANLLYPEVLADEAAKLAKAGKIKCTILDMDEARRRGMGAFIGVAQGSSRPGRIIILEYHGAGKNSPPVALIGKAITFDSGGLTLKGGEGMHKMKTDMSGGAAVLAVILATARLKLKVNLLAVIPAAENMPDGGAYRPGDVLTSMSGRTIEIISTDAEGRLIMADSLSLALTYKPSRLIDVATLTGACVVALGEKCAGLLSTSEELVRDLKQASQTTGELVWPMPIIEEYSEQLDSDVADCKNIGNRFGSAITAALFLKQFVEETPWAHLDIAGPARTDKATPDIPVGATGFGVQLLLNYLRKL
ncbi:MAG: leucyl aminopeptidase [Deltaproteobacteria bacterium]|nr:leucyl aminopeptidase [Deltaproteobacteria bacterium]